MGLAADRGVTICFADLDGADGLWVPEERTILVSRGLPEHRVNEVIEHELAHVAIDDQHAELDAGVYRPPPGPLQTLLAKRWATPALSAAAFLALVGGVTFGLAATLPDGNAEVISPTPGTTEGPISLPSGLTVSPSVDASGRTVYVTVSTSPGRPGTPVPSPTVTVAVTSPGATARVPGSTVPTRVPTRTTSPTPVVTTTSPAPVDTTTPPVTTDPPVTTPAGVTQPGDTGGLGDTTDAADATGGSIQPGPTS